MMPRGVETAILVGYVVAVVLAVGLSAPPIVRAPLVLGFVAFCPGFAWTRLLGLPERWIEVVIGVPLSLAITMLVAMTTVYLNVWSYQLVLVALVGLTLLPLMWTPTPTSQQRPESP